MGLNNISKLNEQELNRNIPFEASWHQEYKDTSYIYFGNFPTCTDFKLILTIFSQFGVPVKLKLARSKDGEFKGFGWLKYENWLSCVLAIDNLNGVPITVRLKNDENNKKNNNFRNLNESQLQNNEVVTRYIKVDHAIYTAKLDDNGNEIANKYDLEIERELKKDFADFQVHLNVDDDNDKKKENNLKQRTSVETIGNNRKSNTDRGEKEIELAW